MASLGMILRKTREAQGRSVAEVADALCITQSYVRAMEADDLASLPGAFFYKSFVKQYADLLGIPASQWQDALPSPPPSEDVPAPQGTPAEYKVFRVPDPILVAANKLDLSGRRIGTSLAALVVAVVACTSFYGWWMDRPAQAIPPAGVDPAGVNVVSQVPAEQASQSMEANVQSYEAPEEGMPSLDVTTTTDADGVRRVVLNLSAKERTWLSITSDGQQVFSGTLQPSETKTLTGLEVARMKVGNAGGLDIRWNGKPIGPIGERGQVRTVLFTPDDFRIISPAPKAAETPAEPL